MKTIEELKGDMAKSFQGIQENSNKQCMEINKYFQDLEMKMIKKK